MAAKAHAKVQGQFVSRHPLRATWKNMIGRCYNPNHVSYERYGARGIRVCTRWKNSFAAFVADMGKRPTGMTVERSNNSKGYSPSNCKWATRSEQGLNRRVHVNSTTKVTGVCFLPKEGRYRAGVMIKGKTFYIGWFDAKHDAIIARTYFLNGFKAAKARS